MKVLITRPREDAEDTAQKLAALGHEGIVAPLLATEFGAGTAPDLDGVQAVLFTSANGVKAWVHRRGPAHATAFAVGPQTSEAAKGAGFGDVRNADGDSRKLALMVRDQARPEAGTLVHVHGGEGGALAQELRGHGYHVREEVLYRVMPAELAGEATALLATGAVDAALFFSPRSARIFRELAQKAGWPTQSLLAACISPAAAKALAPLSFAEIRIAAAPNQAALLAVLDSVP